MSDHRQTEIPIQPVNEPIICSPYDEPKYHYLYNTTTGEASKTPGRRPASYWYKTQRTGSMQTQLFAEEERDDLPLVNALRNDVRRWRESNYESPSVTPVTRLLLNHWNRKDRGRRLFFCQIEAAETIIYINEVLVSARKPRWKTELSSEDYDRLTKGERPSFIEDLKLTAYPRLLDQPNEQNLSPLIRYGSKMATGSGKTVVMSMLIAWAFCNRGRSGDTRFPSAALIVCPNTIIKERLQVLRTDCVENYYKEFDIVPSQLMPELQKGKVLVTNWHLFAPESPHNEGGKSYAVVNKGDESPEAFAQRVLGDLYERAPIMVMNDEGHHAYRPAQIAQDTKLSVAEKEEREEATIWISGLDKINKACGIKFTIDLSATPFYLQGSGYIEGSPFPWLVSDFGLVDAIESGIVKIPRLPVSDTTGRPEPQFFALWKNIISKLQPGDKLPGGKPKPEVVWREAHPALATLMGQWVDRFNQYNEATPEKEHIPPAIIIVCDNTDIAELFYRNISGEDEIEIVNENLDDIEDVEIEEGKKKKKPKTKTVYGQGKIFPEYFSNRDGFRSTLRIDSKLLADAESEDPNASKKDAAKALREIVYTIGKPGKAGEKIRCVVSVQMLNEGWDANNVTNILGLRAFQSQLLCEQVVGRGLRRRDYTVDPETKLLSPEYVDVYGIPFSIIPFKGRPTSSPAPEDRPKNHVKALEERGAFQIRFPVVENFVFALKKNLIKANIDKMEPLILEPIETPTAVFVKPQVGYQVGLPSLGGNFETVEQDRTQYYKSVHIQTIKFEIARQIVITLGEGLGNAKARLKLQSRHQLFPQVLQLVDEYVNRKVNFHGCHKSELGMERYIKQTVERLIDAIEPNSEEGEPPLLPVLNRYKPFGSTSQVDFVTTKPVFLTERSHINAVAADTQQWEQSLAFRLEQSKVVSFYAKNDHMEFTIPYEFLGISHSYIPDFIVRLSNGITLLLELKGHEDEQDRAKYQAAKRWISAVNNWGKLGTWSFHVCKDPQMLGKELGWFVLNENVSKK